MPRPKRSSRQNVGPSRRLDDTTGGKGNPSGRGDELSSLSDRSKRDRRSNFLSGGPALGFHETDRGYWPKQLKSLLEQSSLLSRQIDKLNKLARADVPSVYSERQRVLNRRIAAGPAGKLPEELESAFRAPSSSSQEVLWDMLLRHGLKLSTLAKPGARAPSQIKPPCMTRFGNSSVKEGRREDFLILTGPLCGVFRRAVQRGYEGTPDRWLRSRTGIQRIAEYQQKCGVIHRAPIGGYSITQSNSPLRLRVQRLNPVTNSLPRGPLGEKLYHYTNIRTMVMQTRQVSRCPVHAWPLPGRGYPAIPTLEESVERLVTGNTRNMVSSAFLPFRPKRKTRGWRFVANLKPRAVSKYVLGLRADIGVPKNLLGFFRARWGFLILRRHRNLHPPLVEFLIATWRVAPSAMMLTEQVHLSAALSRTAGEWFRTRPFVAATDFRR